MRGRCFLAAATALLCGACSTGGRLPGAVAGSVVALEDTSVSYPPCDAQQDTANDPVASYPPLPVLPAAGTAFDDTFMQAVLARGKLRVGVSADTLLFGARNLGYVAGNDAGELAYEGFDIDVLTEVALAIFGGGRSNVGGHLEFKAIPYRDRIPALQNKDVDIVAHTMTINCKRWLQIAFSAEYFRAGQRILVTKGAPYDSIKSLADARATVCVPSGSTNEEELAKYPNVMAIAPLDISDCLVLLQQGRVDAITGDDTVLAGLAVQDPATVVVGEQFTQEPYGLGIASDNVYFVRFVNRVLADMVDDGRWAALYLKWLVPSLTATPGAPPTPLYDRVEG